MKRAAILILFIFLLTTVFTLAGCKKVTSTEFSIDRQSCMSCGRCLQVCPSDAIDFDMDGKAIIDQTKCTQCGRCVRVCPKDAIY